MKQTTGKYVGKFVFVWCLQWCFDFGQFGCGGFEHQIVLRWNTFNFCELDIFIIWYCFHNSSSHLEEILGSLARTVIVWDKFCEKYFVVDASHFMLVFTYIHNIISSQYMLNVICKLFCECGGMLSVLWWLCMLRNEHHLSCHFGVYQHSATTYAACVRMMWVVVYTVIYIFCAQTLSESHGISQYIEFSEVLEICVNAYISHPKYI